MNSPFERTLVLIKPDGVRRGLTGEIMTRFERADLMVVAAKLVRATEGQINGHLHGDDNWVRGMGQKTLDELALLKKSPNDTFNSSDPLEIGRQIKKWLAEFLQSGKVFVMVIEGIDAVSAVRKMIGHTIPAKAAPGTIRGDYSTATADSANRLKQACPNLIHASGTLTEAQQEITNWFTPNELD